MAKSNYTNVVIVAVLALIAGFFIGYSIRNFPPAEEDLAGSIGKVERYKNVQVSEQDIQLRNELLDDTAKRSLYENYLMVYYYQAVKTSADVQTVLDKAQSVDGFVAENQQLVDDLSKYNAYLNTARVDILNAINLLFAMDSESKSPIMSQMNVAQNAIVRTNSQNALLIRCMDALADFTEKNDDRDMSALDDAYDVLTINLLQSALISVDKPLLSYFDKKGLKSDKDKAEKIAKANDSVIKDMVSSDFNSLHSASGNLQAGFSNQALLGVVNSNVQNLGIIFQSGVMESFNTVGSVVICNTANFASNTNLQNAIQSQSMGSLLLSLSDLIN